MRRHKRAWSAVVVLALLLLGALIMRAVVNFWVLWLLLMIIALGTS